METKRHPFNTQIAIVVVIAGLISGIVIAWHLTRPEPTVRYAPEYPVVDPATAEAATLAGIEPADAVPAESTVDAPPAEATGAASPADPGDTPAPASGAEPSGADREVIRGANERMEEQGVTERVELTEGLYVRLSAEVVIFTNAAQHEPNASDIHYMQQLIADFTGRLLAEHHVDPQDYYDYTQWVASDHERARQIGEKILRAAEKRAQMRIDVTTVPGIAPAPVAPPDN